MNGRVRRLLAGAALGALAILVVALAFVARSLGEMYGWGASVPFVNVALGDYRDLVRGRVVVLLAQHLMLGAILGAVVAGARELRRDPERPLDRLSWSLRQVAGVGVAAGVPLLVASTVYPAVFEPAFLQLGAGWLHVFLAERAGPWPIVAMIAAALMRFRAIRRAGAALAVVLALIWLLPPGRKSAPPRPHIVLLIADSVRPDYIGEELTPNLQQLAAEGFSFGNATTVVPRTTPSWASMMTGCYPAETGIRSTFSRASVPKPGIATLPAALAKAGYHTAVFADGIERPLADRSWGFEHIDVPDGDFGSFVKQMLLMMCPMLLPWALTEPGRAIWPELAGGFWLASNPAHLERLLGDCLDEHSDRPVFAVVFFALAHVPFAAPYPDGLRFVDPAYEGEHRFARFPDSTADRLTPSEQERVKQLYKGCLASVDRAVGRIRERIAGLGLEESTVLVFTSDHGEALFEGRPTFGHGERLQPAELRVPMMVKHAARGSSGIIARTIDLAPTLLDFAGAGPLPSASGVSLRPVIEGRVKDPGLLGYAETDLWLSDQDAYMPESDRIKYPDFKKACYVDKAAGDRLMLRPQYPWIVDVAKHRKVWSRAGSLEYRPTPSGVKWLRDGDVTGLQERFDELMLGRFGFKRSPEGFYLPPR